VSGRTACDRLVGRLVSHGEPEGVWSRLGMGLFLLRQAYEESLSGEATRGLPIDGIKEELVAHGQAGQFYRHLYFHIGCRFLGWPGTFASWFMHQVDVRQASTGRMESAVELKDNEAALAADPGGVRLTGPKRGPIFSRQVAEPLGSSAA
jgi:hypothetical protein